MAWLVRHIDCYRSDSANGLPDAAPTGAIRVEPRFILQRHGGLHHAQGALHGDSASGVGGMAWRSTEQAV